MNHWSTVEETVEEHVVVRESLTQSLHLGLFPATLETEPVVCRQVCEPFIGSHWIKGDVAPFPAMYHYMVETTDNRLVWKSDRTLLTTAKQLGTNLATLKREGGIRSGANTAKTLTTDYTNTPASDMTEVVRPALNINLRKGK